MKTPFKQLQIKETSRMHRIQAQVKKIKLGRHNSAPKLSCALLLKPLLMPVYKPPSISTGRAVRIDISDPRFLSQTLVEEIFVASNPETQQVFDAKMIQFQKVVDKVRQRMSWTRSSEDLVKPSFSKSTYSSPKKKVLPIKIKSSAVEKQSNKMDEEQPLTAESLTKIRAKSLLEKFYKRLGLIQKKTKCEKRETKIIEQKDEVKSKRRRISSIECRNEPVQHKSGLQLQIEEYQRMESSQNLFRKTKEFFHDFSKQLQVISLHLEDEQLNRDKQIFKDLK